MLRECRVVHAEGGRDRPPVREVDRRRGVGDRESQPRGEEGGAQRRESEYGEHVDRGNGAKEIGGGRRAVVEGRGGGGREARVGRPRRARSERGAGGREPRSDEQDKDDECAASRLHEPGTVEGRSRNEQVKVRPHGEESRTRRGCLVASSACAEQPCRSPARQARVAPTSAPARASQTPSPSEPAARS